MKREGESEQTMRRIRPVTAVLVLGAIIIVAGQIGITPAAALSTISGVLGQLGISTRDLIAAGVGAAIVLMIRGQR